MSIKTLRKRIALVAVSALGASFMMTVSAPSANATAAAGDSGVILVSGSICGATSLTGTTPLEADGGTDASPFESGAASGKIVTVPVGGQLTVAYDASDKVTISGPLSIASLTTAGTAVVATSAITNGKVVVTGAAVDGSFTVNALSAGTATLVVDTANGDPTATATNTIKVSIVAECASSTFVAAASYVSVEDTSTGATDNVDTSASQADTEQGFLSVVANNAYGTAVPSGVFIGSCTNGARVDIASGGAAAASTTGASTDAVTAAGTDIRLAVAQKTQGVAMTSVCTISYNGTDIASRTFSWTGDLAKITVSSVRIGKTNDQNFNAFVVKTYDAAGNQIAWADANLTVTGTDQNVTAADAVLTATAAGTTTATNDGNYFTCGATAYGKSKLKVKGIATSLAVVYSDEFEVSCAGASYSYSASLDKASYVPGDIATLTITAKDVYGNLVYGPVSSAANSTIDLKNYCDSTNAPAIAGSNMTAVTATTTADYFLNGVLEYTYVVGSTEGNYQMTVNCADIDVAVTIPYAIKLTSAGVSNAEVLAAIVKLIASINKQITLLQKQIKKSLR